ncbi:MAG TPA: xanthine dehydrogenase family protein subunit M [Actinomycetota bacterium]|nr:xanthine dehydrogenase family protein subunit M [Actinomycetota bacterium]
MKPAPFEYFAPTDIEEALELLGRGGDVKVLAGGQSLVPAMSFRLATPEAIVDLNGIRDRDRVAIDGDELVVGMLARHRALETSAVPGAVGALLVDTARLVGHLPIRVRGTFSGSLAHADPAAEWPMLALALDASILARSAAGSRVIAAADFFEGPFTTALREDEIITEVRLLLLPDAGTAVLEQSRTAGDFATVAVVAVVIVTDGTVSYARVAAAGVEGRPVRFADAESLLLGSRPEPEVFAEAGRVAAESIDPLSDATASADYRRHLVEVLVRRALDQARSRLAV